jgi:isochorismate synthase EntC
LDVIASVIKKHNSKKSLQTIEKLYKQTAESLQKLEIELKKPTISKTEIKNTISLIQKQIKQMQSELKKLDK